MIAIGFDPGSIRFGVGVLKKENDKISFVHAEVIRLDKGTFNEKMKILWFRLQELYREYAITEAAIEDGFLGKNVKTMDMLSRVRGLVLGSAIASGIGLTSYAPREVKLSLAGTGTASKEQVSKMVKTLLHLQGRLLDFDASDACAVAYCHLLTARQVFLPG